MQGSIDRVGDISNEMRKALATATLDYARTEALGRTRQAAEAVDRDIDSQR